MNKGTKYIAFLACLIVSATPLAAQSTGNTSKGLLIGLIVAGAILLLWAIISITDNLMQIEANKAGIDSSKENMSLFPRLIDVFSKKSPGYTKNEHFVRLTKGYDIPLAGAAEGKVETSTATRVSVSPYDFRGITPIPKVVVAAGDEVKAGDVLFFDKNKSEIKYVSPVSGEVLEVKRGAKRSIADVIILADKEQTYKSISAPDISTTSREDLVEFLAESGAWTLFNQRPFDVIPALTDLPRDIFISTFDTAPLAPDSNIIIEGNGAAFQKGVDVLTKLTAGKVHVGINANGSKANPIFSGIKNAEKHYFSGPHPAGNVGIQIHHINPIGLEDIVWTLGVQEVVTLGKLFTEGKYDGSRIVALTGAELKAPVYVKTYQGVNLGELVKDRLNNDHVRIVSGDVLSGTAKKAEDFLGFHDDQVTVIEEGDNYEFLAWLAPVAPRPSISNTYPKFLYPKYKHRANSNTHGEERAFVVTGDYERLLPMDIYPQFLMKSIMTQEIEKMEGLGINELTEEDVALCEFACVSKAPLQQILREGLDIMRAQQ